MKNILAYTMFKIVKQELHCIPLYQKEFTDDDISIYLRE